MLWGLVGRVQGSESWMNDGAGFRSISNWLNLGGTYRCKYILKECCGKVMLKENKWRIYYLPEIVWQRLWKFKMDRFVYNKQYQISK